MNPCIISSLQGEGTLSTAGTETIRAGQAQSWKYDLIMTKSYYILRHATNEELQHQPGQDHSFQTEFEDSVVNALSRTGNVRVVHSVEQIKSWLGKPTTVAFTLADAKELAKISRTYLAIPKLIKELPPEHIEFFQGAHRNRLGLISMSPSQAEAIKNQSNISNIKLLLPLDIDLETPSTTLQGIKQPKCKEFIPDFSGVAIDSCSYNSSAQIFHIPGFGGLHGEFGPTQTTWNEVPISLSFRKNDFNGRLLDGFYPSETWGSWSRTESPAVNLPYLISGEVKLELEVQGYGKNAGREITVAIGPKVARITLKSKVKKYSIAFHLDSPESRVQFLGLNTEVPKEAADTRTMAIGIVGIRLSRPRTNAHDTAADIIDSQPSPINGVIYTSFLPPNMQHAGWKDLVTAFTRAFRGESQATLILLAPHCISLDEQMELALVVERSLPYACRVIILAGRISKADLSKIVKYTSFYININYFPDTTVPDIFFQAAGALLIAPVRSNPDTSLKTDPKQPPFDPLLFDAFVEPTKVLYTEYSPIFLMKYRFNWESLVDCLRNSFELCTEGKNYSELSKSSAGQALNFLQTTGS